jgi:hypothetical protein
LPAFPDQVFGRLGHMLPDLMDVGELASSLIRDGVLTVNHINGVADRGSP